MTTKTLDIKSKVGIAGIMAILGLATAGNVKIWLNTPITYTFEAEPVLAQSADIELPKIEVEDEPAKVLSVSDINAQAEVLDAIAQASEMFNVPEKLLLDIALAESSYIPTNKHVGSGATGLFQFLPSTWSKVVAMSKNPAMSLYGKLPSEDPNDPYANAMGASYLIKYGQLGKWDASEWNWGNNWEIGDLEDMGFYDQSLYHAVGIRPSVRLGL